jgi:hypothetical protein
MDRQRNWNAGELGWMEKQRESLASAIFLVVYFLLLLALVPYALINEPWLINAMAKSYHTWERKIVTNFILSDRFEGG